MNCFFRKVGAAGLVAGMLLAGGCGSDDSNPQGQVVKGPVVGAKVTYKDGKSVTTDANGYYASNGQAVTTSGGSYTDMNGAFRTAPDMASPAGKSNVTPLTTLYVNASPADQEGLLALLGGRTSIDTVVTGTVSGATNVLVAKLNESLGEVLTQIRDGKAVTSPAYLAGLATQVAKLTSTPTAADIVNAINANTVKSAVIINTAAITKIADATRQGSVVPSGPAPSGSSGSTGGITQN